jgi:2-phosphosulfolactate phosphatase
VRCDWPPEPPHKLSRLTRTVAIDCFPESAERYRDGWAVVPVDVIRATTTAVTAVALGRRCFPVPSLEAAVPLAARLDDPLLVGELGGNMPYGFDLNNTPAGMAELSDVSRPMILLSTSGTRLIDTAGGAEAVYPACLRNVSAQARYLDRHHEHAALIGAGARGEFREEDQLCCAWVAELLLAAAWEAADEQTSALVERWSGVEVRTLEGGASAEYLRRSGQLHDLDFVLTHVDDLDAVFRFEQGEIHMVPA